jgi:hypothetical protein
VIKDDRFLGVLVVLFWVFVVLRVATLLSGCGAATSMDVQPGLVAAFEATARLERDGTPICTAVLVDRGLAITAGHCVRTPGSYTLDFGADGMLPVLSALTFDDRDLALLHVTPTELSRAPVSFGASLVGTVIGYGCSRMTVAEPRAVWRAVGVDKHVSDWIGAVCHGDSGSGVWYGGKLVGIAVGIVSGRVPTARIEEL